MTTKTLKIKWNGDPGEYKEPTFLSNILDNIKHAYSCWRKACRCNVYGHHWYSHFFITRKSKKFLYDMAKEIRNEIDREILTDLKDMIRNSRLFNFLVLEWGRNE